MKAMDPYTGIRPSAGGVAILLALTGALFGVPDARANAIALHDWDSGPEAWTSEYNDVNLETEATGGNPNGWLEITFPETTAPEILEDEWVDIVRVDKDDFFAGNWHGGMGIKFDFYASNELPQNVQLQFYSATSTNVWGYNVTDQITETQTWTTVTVGLQYSDAWGPLPGYDDTEEQFLADLAAIDWIGVYIFREEAGVEVYGLDNFRLLVPEPGQWSMLSAVLLSALCGRKRRTRPRDARASRPPAPPG